ncbi:MAG: serine/threonine-protein kinase, partial [Gemmataceae bacterium]
MAIDPARAKSLFLAASDLSDPADRAAYLDRECPDAGLRARVEALLAADAAGSDGATGTQPPAGPPLTVDHAGPAARAGTALAGKYRLVEEIGAGGMGTVWLAQQSEPVKRKVAVKLIKAGMDSESVLARFDAERQALAVMDHPNIAKVLDGGLTPDGLPFFVMELVKGVPITEYCDARKLTPRERLELFVPVCHAIQHAHQKGIIHRDIKPSNVLVALYDDRPVPKVIDFGVAKATGGALTEHTIETAFGGVVGTPQYMSPEQASLNNLDIDTRSDVYSLGVLLYELLTGTPPFSKADLEKKGLLEILRVVREEEPPRPSTKLSTADALPSLSANRGTEPRELTGLLRNELDWIVMKALEKDRARRYETANGFAADVSRYLAGEAVQAHPPSAAYRVKKFVRRNRVQVIAAGLVLAALVAGIAGTTAGLIEAKRQERLAGERLVQVEAERAKADAAKLDAEAKAAEANAVVQFFENRVFAAARPKGQAGGLGAGVTLRDAVAASVPALETGFEQQPLVEARLRDALGNTFLYLAEHEKARDQFERARALFTRHLGPDHPVTLASMQN